MDRILNVPHASGAYQWALQFVGLLADPTGNLPEFQLVEIGHTPDDMTIGTWTDGAWSVAYDSTIRTAWASTPLIGTGGLTVAAGKRYALLARLNFGSGLTPIYQLAQVHVAGSDTAAPPTL